MKVSVSLDMTGHCQQSWYEGKAEHNKYAQGEVFDRQTREIRPAAQAENYILSNYDELRPWQPPLSTAAAEAALHSGASAVFSVPH